MDRKLFNLFVLLDLKNAFDTVNHDILLCKLELHDLTGNALSMIQSYLSDRKQQCQLGNVMSSELHLKCGIPQGSILDPLLFLIYINDLLECLNYANLSDDASLTAAESTIDKIELAINRDLDCIKEWLSANKLSLNVRKTEFIVIGTNKKLKIHKGKNWVLGFYRDD